MTGYYAIDTAGSLCARCEPGKFSKIRAYACESCPLGTTNTSDNLIKADVTNVLWALLTMYVVPLPVKCVAAESIVITRVLLHVTCARKGCGRRTVQQRANPARPDP